MNNVHNESVALLRRWRPLEIHQLKYALAVAKNRSFVRAAYELCITPPALSQQIKKLEDELELLSAEARIRGMNLEDFLSLCSKVFVEMEVAVE